MILPITLLFAVEVISTEAIRNDIFTATPSNLAIIAGEPLRLECGFAKASKIHWYYQAPRIKAKNILIYNGETFNNKVFVGDFSVSSSAERRDLVANEAKLEHAGVYDCVVLISTTSSIIDQRHSARAQVIVLASDPMCSSNLSNPGDSASEFDTVLIQCDLKYAGGWFPVMHWFKKTNNRSNQLERALTDPSNVQSASSFVIFQVNSSDNGAVIICKTHFISSDNQVTTIASNIPDYVYHWNITLNVEYSPKNIFVQPLLDSYDINSNLSCEADGNPVPEYTWEDMETLAVASGSTIVISKGIIENDAQYAYRCTAQNTVKGHIMTDSVTVTVKFKVGTTKGGYITVPSNLAVVAGEPLRLECGFANASNIHWYYQASSTKTNSVLIYNGEAISTKIFAGDFSINSSSAERRDLVAKEAKLEHAGIYDCVVLISTMPSVIEQRYSARVIVLASDPMCSSNLTNPGDSASEFDAVLIQCDLKYAGGWSPKMHWFKKIHNRSYQLERALTDLSYVQNASSFVILQINSSDNGAVIICKTLFISSDNQVTTNASNIPDYAHHWNITLNVEYGPKNTFVQPLLDSYDINSNLSCEADGNPVPVYTWEDMETQAVTSGPTIVISKGIVENDAQYAYKCTAQNTVKGHIMKNSVTVTVTIKGNFGLVIRGYIFGLVGVVAGIVISVVVFKLRLRMRKRSQDGSQQRKTISDAPADQLHRESSVHQPVDQYEVMMRRSSIDTINEGSQTPEHETTSLYAVIETYADTDQPSVYYNLPPT